MAGGRGAAPRAAGWRRLSRGGDAGRRDGQRAAHGDVYTAKLAGRSGRDALAPERALRELLLAERANPFAQALAAEFGSHPPGTTVRLHNSEVAIVVRRGAEPSTPTVAVVTSHRAEILPAPFLREAAGIAHGIAAQIDPRGVKARCGPEQLLEAVAP